MNRSLRYVLLALLWSAVAGYLCFAGAVAVRGRAKRTVSRVEIEVVDSTSRGCLVSTMRAREWIGRSGIPTIGTAVDAVDLRGIERLIARNGFVKEAIASVDYSGTLRVSISQREPLLRLLTDGTNSYVTADGYVFAAPKASSLYVPVVTGDYRLPFPKDYVGSVHAYMQAELAKSEARIAALEKEKYPFFRQEIELERRMKEVRRRRIRQGFFERATDFERRVAELREEKTVLRRKFRYEAAQVQERIDRLGRRQEEERERQKKIGRKLRRFRETPYLCGKCPQRCVLEVGNRADNCPHDPRRSLGGRSGAAQRPPCRPFRASGAGRPQVRQADALLRRGPFAHRMGPLPDHRHQI